MYRVYTKVFLCVILTIIIGFLGLQFFHANLSSFKRWFSSTPAEQPLANLPKERYEEGKQYKRISAQITTNPVVQEFIARDPGKIQVIEFFGYACFWCQRLHPFLNEWAAKKPEDIVFYRFPVYFNKGWDVLAKAYYIVEKLGSNNTLDKAFFQALHQEHLDLGNEQKLEAFFQKHGVSQQKFQELYHSFEVNRDYAKGNAIANAYEIIVSPAVVLNLSSGSYLITASSAGTEQGVIDIISFLIARDLKESKSASISESEKSKAGK
jgi:thiol:disulfide interchange protein DsbA